MDSNTALFILLVGLGLAFVLFLVLREVTLWYFKINQMAKSLAYLEDYFRRLEQSKKAQAAPAPSAGSAPIMTDSSPVARKQTP